MALKGGIGFEFRLIFGIVSFVAAFHFGGFGLISR